MSDLPETVAIMVVDTKGFSAHNDLQQEELFKLIPDVLEQACRRCDLDELWDGRQFPDSTGDGFIIGFEPRLLPRVVDSYFEALQAELNYRRPRLKADDIRLRMRLSLELGPAQQLKDLAGSPVGAAMISTHRIVDADPLRVLLDTSDPEATLLAVAISERVMTDVVLGGRTRRRGASEFAEIDLSIPKKGFAAKAYLHVPVISGELLRHGLIGVQDRRGPVKPAAPTSTRGKAAAPAGVSDVSGNNNVVGGRDARQTTNHTSVGRDQYNANHDQHFGPGHNR